MRVLFLIVMLLTIGGQCFSQERLKKDFNLDEFIEQTFPTPDEDLPYEELYESLYQYYQAPLNINNATRKELASLYILSELQINNFISYREAQKNLEEIYELQAIEGFDLTTIHKLLPFVQVSSGKEYRSTLKDVLYGHNKYFLLRYDRTVENKKGYWKEENGYQGSPDKLIGRFRSARAKDYSLGFTFEKDAGESLQWNPHSRKYGLDFWSYHVSLENKGFIKKIIAGDYQLQFGQGLILGAGFSPGKGGEAVSTLRRYNTGIRPYTSVVETGFFRGAASTVKVWSAEITGFYSTTNEDAALKSDTLDEDYITSIQLTGFHRTPSELLSRKKINLQNLGGNLNFSLFKKALELGVTYLYSRYEVPIQRKPTKYNQFEFSGKENAVLGINYSYIVSNFNFFGEAAQSRSGGIGVIAGMLASISNKTDLSIVYRKYDKEFHTLYGNAFGENTKNINEEGLYVGLKISPVKKVTVNTYVDRYYKPWLSYQAYAPSHGIEYLGRIDLKLSKTINLFFQARNEVRGKNSKEESTVAKIQEESVLKLLFNIDFKPLNALQLKSRVQFASVKQGNYKSEGMTLFQDVTLRFRKFTISGRYCLFDTDDYASRQYTYEKDVLYTFSFPALYGNGVRNYLLIQYDLLRNLDLWIKASRTGYNDRDVIGSGLEEIAGSTKTDLRFQIRYKF